MNEKDRPTQSPEDDDMTGGDHGAKGDQGAKGDRGTTGRHGTTGDRGAKGDRGTTGRHRGLPLHRVWGLPGGVWALVVVVLVGAWHFGAIYNAFYFDDRPQILEGQLNRSWESVGTIFASEVWRNVEGGERLAKATVDTYRPLFNLSLLVDYQVAGLRPAWYHAMNLLIHLINVWLVFWVGRRIVGDGAAVAAAAFFGVHPAALTCIHYVSSRPDSASTLFVLLSAGVALQGRWRFGGRVVGAAASLFVALLWKETALIALVAVPLLYWVGDEGAAPRRALAMAVALVGAAAVYFALRFNALHAAKAIEDGSHAVAMLLSYPKALLYWLRAAALVYTPLPLHAFAPLGWPVAGWVLALVVAVYAGIAGVGFGAVFRRWRWAVLLLWSLMGIAPALAAVVRTDVIDGHYFYPVVPGMALLLGLGLCQPFWRRVAGFWRPVVAGLIIASAAARSGAAGASFRTEVGFYGAIVESGYHVPSAIYSFANALQRAGRVDEAVVQYRRVLREHPRYADAKAHNNLSVALLQQGDAQGAEAHAREALARQPGEARYHYNLALALAKQRRWAAFGESLGRALALDPQHADARKLSVQFCASAQGRQAPGLCGAGQ